jgi:hypothetical protein
MSSITIVYDVQPPTGTSQSDLATSKSQSFAFDKNDNYYAGLRGAIATAKETVGKELTEWRDRVGDLEKGKDAKQKSEESSEEEEEPEE